MKFKFLVITILVFCLILPGITVSKASAKLEERPNLVVIVVDDQRWDELGAAGHPFLKTPNIDKMAKEGALFTNSYAVSPLCSPNRASIMTGQNISSHGIVDNIARNKASHRLRIFAKELQAAGYETAHVGKWHMGNDPTKRPGYDKWVCIPGQGESINPIFWEDGKLNTINGYVTDVLTDISIDFIKKERDKPFFLYIGHKAVHPQMQQKDDGSVDFDAGMSYIPADRHKGIYEKEMFKRRKNADKEAIAKSDKEVIKAAIKQKESDANRKIFGNILDHGTAEETIRRRSEMLLAVDESLGRIMKELKAINKLDNTVIVFTSDNGFYYGEHGLSIERRLPYEETIRVPMLIRYPKLIKGGTKIDDFALSIDIAPTMLDLGEAKIGDHINGKSLVPLFKEKNPNWRKSFLVEYVSYEKPMPWLIGTSYKAIRSGNYKYIHWIHHPEQNELYDLAKDPEELHNLAKNPKMKKVIKKLRGELGVLIAQAVGLQEVGQ